MTLDEAVALLREARSSVALEVAAVAAFRVSDADKRVLDLLARINAALAAHDAKPKVVESDSDFSRGAEAMRNQVLGVTEVYEKLDRTCDYDAGWLRASERIAEHVRNLPVPEVTP